LTRSVRNTLEEKERGQQRLADRRPLVLGCRTFCRVQAQLANEMLVRGAILGGGSKWIGVYLTTVQRVPESTSAAVAGWLMLALVTSVVVLRQWKMFTKPLQITTAKVEKDKITGKLKVIRCSLNMEPTLPCLIGSM
jgi:hypothetical protein